LCHEVFVKHRIPVQHGRQIHRWKNLVCEVDLVIYACSLFDLRYIFDKDEVFTSVVKELLSMFDNTELCPSHIILTYIICSSSVVTLSCPPTVFSLKITDRSFRYASPRLCNQLRDSFRQPHHSCLDSPPHPLVS